MDALMSQETSESFLRPFNQDGVFVFRKLINADDLSTLKIEVNNIHELSVAFSKFSNHVK